MDAPPAPPSRWTAVALYTVLGSPLLLIGYFVWAHVRSDNIASNERHASAATKLLASAQADFRGNERDGNGVQDFWTGDVAGLFYRPGPDGAPLRLIEQGVADADARPLKPLPGGPVAYHGYYFRVMTWDESETPREPLQKETDKTSGKVHHPAKFAFCAYPVKYGVTGRNTYIINEGNTVFWTYRNGEPMDHWPSDHDRRHQWSLGD